MYDFFLTRYGDPDVGRGTAERITIFYETTARDEKNKNETIRSRRTAYSQRILLKLQRTMTETDYYEQLIFIALHVSCTRVRIFFGPLYEFCILFSCRFTCNVAFLIYTILFPLYHTV